MCHVHYYTLLHSISGAVHELCFLKRTNIEANMQKKRKSCTKKSRWPNVLVLGLLVCLWTSRQHPEIPNTLTDFKYDIHYTNIQYCWCLHTNIRVLPGGLLLQMVMMMMMMMMTRMIRMIKIRMLLYNTQANRQCWHTYKSSARRAFAPDGSCSPGLSHNAHLTWIAMLWWRWWWWWWWCDDYDYVYWTWRGSHCFAF